MPRGIYQHRPGQGFLNAPHTYTVVIGASVYHKGDRKRDAEHAFRRALKGSKGEPAPAKGKTMILLRDGNTVLQRVRP